MGLSNGSYETFCVSKPFLITMHEGRTAFPIFMCGLETLSTAEVIKLL